MHEDPGALSTRFAAAAGFVAGGPLYPGVLRAWRSWRLLADAEAPRLASPVTGHVWTPGARCEAACELGQSPPCVEHGCGIYAFERRLPATHPEVAVVGLVALWGRVIEHERGYRAAYAYPLALAAPAHPAGRAHVARVARVYGCTLV